MMIAGANAGGSRSEKIEGEDGLRTVECLRGRLLAERMASRNAKEEADLMENKLIELEKKLKEESKSRNRAEKKLKFLMEKLESLNISYVSVSDESDNSASGETIYSSNDANFEELSIQKEEIKEVVKEKFESDPSSSSSVKILDNSAAKATTLDPGNGVDFPELTIMKDCRSLTVDCLTHSSGDHQKAKKSIKDDHSLRTLFKKEKLINEEDDGEEMVDNSLALVTVDLPKTNQQQPIDPVILDATVKEVLDALRNAKEKIQTSMERKRSSMIKV